MYIYIYTRNPFVLRFGPKQCLFQSKQGSFGFHIYLVRSLYKPSFATVAGGVDPIYNPFGISNSRSREKKLREKET